MFSYIIYNRYIYVYTHTHTQSRSYALSLSTALSTYIVYICVSSVRTRTVRRDAGFLF